MKIEGAIFDLDGTLFDSMFIWDTIGEAYLHSRGIKPHENLKETFKTMSLKQAAEYYISEYGLTDSVQEIMDGVNKMIQHLYTDAVQTKPGAESLLQKLSASGVKLCIATATDRHLVEAALIRCGIMRYFSGIFTCTEVGCGKDNPEIFERALKHLGTSKEHTVVFEDALYAVKTAKAAGFTVVGVYDAHERGDVHAVADIYVCSLEEAGDLIDQKGADDSRFRF